MSMLDKIKAKYDETMAAKNPISFNTDEQETQENNAIMECASFFSELSDLTVAGSDLNDRRSIDVLNIGFDEDVELESFEVSATDGRILDIPADILVHSESYEYMKSYEDFYNEAYENRPRTDMGNNEEIINQNAVKMYKEYLTQIYQEGLFSASKVDLEDPTVQWYRVIDFGPSDPNDPSSKPYVARLPIGYISKDDKKILIKQRDTVSVMIDPFPDQFKTFGAKYIEQLNEKGYTIPAGKNVWDVVIPKRIIVPEQPVDQFVFVIEAENVLSDKPENDYLYMGYAAPLDAFKKKGVSNVAPSELSGKTIKLFTSPASLRQVVDTKSMIKESVAPTPKISIGRPIQEAINFGSDEPPAANGDDSGSGTAEINGGGSSDSDNGGGDAITSAPENTESAATNDDGNKGGPSEAAKDANDVSDQIAEKVANETNKDNANDDLTNVSATDSSDTDDSTSSLDTNLTDISPEDTGNDLEDNMDLDNLDGHESDAKSVDDQLNDLNAEGVDNADGMSQNLDVSSMSFNDLMKHAEDKLKNMSISDLQSFLNDDSTEGPMETSPEVPATTTATESYVFQQEAFILTKKNINAELDATLRKCLGDLNNNQLDMNGIITEFKKDGKKLNRALSKAVKMTDVYSEKEIQSMIKLNKCLTDLLISLKPNASKSEFQTVKRLIKAFVSQAKGVGTIIDKHKNDAPVEDKKSTEKTEKKSIAREVK